MNHKNSQKNIPPDWQLVKLGDILCVGSGKDYKHLEVGNIPVFGTGGYMLSVNKPLYSGETVFIGRKGTIDKPFYFKGDFWTVDTLFYTHKFKDTTAKYINNVFQKIDWKSHNEASGVPSLSKATIEKIKILLPQLPEQNRIVWVLETWDKAIEKLSKKIEVKKQIKKGLMQGLLTGRKRLEGFNDKWETVKLDDVSDFINGYTFKSSSYCDDGKYKIITIANVQDGFMLIDGSKTIKEIPSNIMGDQKLSKGDILVSMTGNVGRVSLVDNNNCLLNQRVGKIKPRNINKDLLYFLLLDRRFLNKMIDSAQGGAQANLSTGDIKEYIVDIPKSKVEQSAIAQILIASEKEISKLENKLKLLKKQRQYLLNNLVTGTIRTPENLTES